MPCVVHESYRPTRYSPVLVFCQLNPLSSQSFRLYSLTRPIQTFNRSQRRTPVADAGVQTEEAQHPDRMSSIGARSGDNEKEYHAFPESFQRELERESWALYALGIFFIVVRMSVFGALRLSRVLTFPAGMLAFANWDYEIYRSMTT